MINQYEGFQLSSEELEEVRKKMAELASSTQQTILASLSPTERSNIGKIVIFSTAGDILDKNSKYYFEAWESGIKNNIEQINSCSLNFKEVAEAMKNVATATNGLAKVIEKPKSKKYDVIPKNYYKKRF